MAPRQISVTTDPAVAVAFNDIPFIRNHFFEQEFYHVGNVEVLRGPQGTLYGRNATAGVVNLSSAKPTDQFEALASADIGNYQNRRFEGMMNLPIVDDRLDLAGEWTKRKGYTFDKSLNEAVDGRDLWSTRVTLGWKPSDDVQTTILCGSIFPRMTIACARPNNFVKRTLDRVLSMASPFRRFRTLMRTTEVTSLPPSRKTSCKPGSARAAFRPRSIRRRRMKRQWQSILF